MNLPSIPAYGFAEHLGKALGTVLVLFCLICFGLIHPCLAQTQQPSSVGPEVPLRAYTWSQPPSDVEYLQLAIRVSPKSDPKAIAAQTLQQPEGQRAILLWDWADSAPLIGHPDDLLPGGFISPWLEHGTAALKDIWKSWIDQFAAAGGNIDIVLMDYENEVSSWTIEGRDHLEAIIADPRSVALDAAMEPYNLADAMEYPAYYQFNAAMMELRGAALEKAIFEPLWNHFPDAVGSNYADYGIAESERAPLLVNGQPVSPAMQHRPVVGTHKNRNIYGWHGGGKGPYTAVQNDVQYLRSMVRSGPAPLNAWVAYYHWTHEGAPVSETPYYKELIFHLALHDPSQLYYWNPHTWSGDLQAEARATDADDRYLDAILTEINAQIGTAKRTVITTDPIVFSDDLIVSGMQTGDEVQWRITTRTPGQAVDVFMGGRKIARLTPADDEAGVWYTSDAGDEVTFQLASGVAPDNNAPDAEFSWEVDNLNVQFTDASADDGGAIAEWSWDFGDGHTSTKENPLHTYTASGSYEVSLTVTDDDGTTDKATKTVDVGAADDSLGDDDPSGDGAPRRLEAPRAQIAIDAVLQDWAELPQEPVTETNPDIDPPDSEADLSGSFFVSWDEEYLYVAAKITDDQYRISDGAAVWANDGIEVLIDGLGNRNPAYGPDDHQVLIRADGTVEAEGYDGGDAIMARGAQTSEGYIVEAAVSWNFIDGDPPTADRGYGFNLNINDRDHGQHEHQLTWTYAPRHWENTSKWGKIILGLHDSGDDHTDETPLHYGTVVVSQSGAGEWHSVSFDEPLTNPVVVMGPLSYYGEDPSTIRVRNVTSTGFEYQIDEWNYLDEEHTTERLSYFAIEAGQHALGALKMEAGLVDDIAGDFKAVDFEQDFSSTPVVLTQVVTTNGSHAVVTRQQHATRQGFEVRLQKEEAAGGGHVNERVAYVAIDAGNTIVDGKRLVAGRADEGVNHEWQVLEFGQMLINPVFLADLQTYHGPNTSGLRYRALSSSGVEVKTDEEQSAGTEGWHQLEEVGYLVVESRETTTDQEMPPIKLVSFRAEREGKSVVLHWQTDHDVHAVQFQVQRRAADRSAWKTIGQAGSDAASPYRFADTRLPSGTETIHYRLKRVDAEGNIIYSRSLKVGQQRPERVVLHGNFPNPFSERTTIRYELPEVMHVQLEIYNLLGQRVATLVDQKQQPGQKEVIFDAGMLASGLYMCRLHAGGTIFIQKMIVIK